MTNKKFILISIIFFLCNYVSAQKDTVIALADQKDSIYIKDVTTTVIDTLIMKKKPLRAALFSTFVPGLGQAYNQKYWKIPIIFSLAGALIYFADNNNIIYHRFLDAYVAKNDTFPDTIDEFDGKVSDDDLLFYKRKYKRNRDLDIILVGVIYIFNIMDASVDAHLSDYDIGDDLSLSIEPIAIPLPKNNIYTYGLRLCLRF